WDDALRDLTEALAFESGPVTVYRFRAALLYLKKGDRASYRRTCADSLRQPRAVTDANTAAWTAVLRPGAVADFGPVLDSATAAVAVAPRDPVVLNTLGAVCYRAGQDEEAVQRLLESMANNPQGSYPEDWLFLALAHQRLGQAPEAK